MLAFMHILYTISPYVLFFVRVFTGLTLIETHQKAILFDPSKHKIKYIASILPLLQFGAGLLFLFGAITQPLGLIIAVTLIAKSIHILLQTRTLTSAFPHMAFALLLLVLASEGGGILAMDNILF